MKATSFEDLIIWKDSVLLTKEIFILTDNDKFKRDFSFRDQLRRAIISVSSNIVEGFERNNNIEFSRYLKISKGSLGEVRSQLYIAWEVNYISRAEFEPINIKLKHLANKMGRLIMYLKENKTRNSPARKQNALNT